MLVLHKRHFVSLLVLTLTLIGISMVQAWTGPASAPPNDNVDAPLNVGSTDQIKNAALGLNGLAIFGNAIVSTTNGYLNFGVTAGQDGYGIRDNAGAMEFKNSGGVWASFASTTEGSSSGAGEYQVFTTSGTWTKPSDTDPNQIIVVEMWGGGGGGYTGGGNIRGGGGGGAFNRLVLRAGNLDASVAVTVGNGGAAGSAGGVSSFGSFGSAYGGSNGNTTGGGGGGILSGGASGSEGTNIGGEPQGGVPHGGASIFGGGAGGYYANSVPGGSSIFGGGGGGGNSIGGNSVYGGAGGGGGGGSTQYRPGGSSTYGGAGGAGTVTGSIPGGGGGTAAAGGRGEVRVWIVP